MTIHSQFSYITTLIRHFGLKVEDSACSFDESGDRKAGESSRLITIRMHVGKLFHAVGTCSPFAPLKFVALVETHESDFFSREF